MDLNLELNKILEHFNNITKEEFEEKLIKHGIEEIKSMDDALVKYEEFEQEEHTIKGEQVYKTSNMYSDMALEKSTFDISDDLFIGVA